MQGEWRWLGCLTLAVAAALPSVSSGCGGGRSGGSGKGGAGGAAGNAAGASGTGGGAGGTAGDGGSAGATGGTGSGAAGTVGAAGGGAAGVAGAAGRGGAAGTAGTGGVAGTPGAAGTSSTGGTSAGRGGAAGSSSTGGTSAGASGRGGVAGAAGAAGASGAAGAAGFPVTCTSVSSGATFPLSSTAGIVRVQWWNNAWLLATDTQVGTFAADGTPIIPFTSFPDVAVESARDPYLAATSAGLLVSYTGRPLDNSYERPRIVALDNQLAVKNPHVTIGLPGSAAGGLSPDGRAIAWYQGYYSFDEGYRFSLLAPTLALSGTTDVYNDIFRSTQSAEIVTGANGFYVFYRIDCPNMQRYDTAGNRVGASVVLKPADRGCPDDTNLYAYRSSIHAVSAAGVHFVAFNDFGANRHLAWAGYAVVDDASGATRAVTALSGMEASGTPTVATFEGKFAMAWPASSSATTRPNLFALVGADGVQLSPVLSLGMGRTSYLGPIVAASPTGFVVFMIASTASGVYTAFNITCR